MDLGQLLLNRNLSSLVSRIIDPISNLLHNQRIFQAGFWLLVFPYSTREIFNRSTISGFYLLVYRLSLQPLIRYVGVFDATRIVLKHIHS